MFRYLIEFVVLKTRIFVSPLFFAVLTLFLLLDKNGLANKVILFSLLHESAHFLAMLCCKTVPKVIKINIFGINISLDKNLSTAKKCAVLIAGFMANFIFAIIFFVLKDNTSVYINLFIGIFTAIPMASTDGGSVIQTLLDEYYPENSRRVFGIISGLFLFFIIIFLIYIAVLFKNYFLIIPIVYMLMMAKKASAI